MLKNKLFLLIVFLIMFALVLSCSKQVNNNVNIQYDENLVSATGTVKFIELEGGFFGIIADDGSKYKPMNLPEDFQKSGLTVRFEGKLNTDIVSIHMWGKLIKLTEISEL